MRSIIVVSVVWLLAAFVSGAAGPVRAQEGDKTTPISGKWKGKWMESNFNRGTVSLELSEEKGKVTGSSGAWGNSFKMENGRRIADTAAWSALIDGKVYLFHGIISDGGKSLTLDYTFIEDKFRGPPRLQKVTGIATLKRE
jgi:hypothetical protein